LGDNGWTARIERGDPWSLSHHDILRVAVTGGQHDGMTATAVLEDQAGVWALIGRSPFRW